LNTHIPPSEFKVLSLIIINYHYSVKNAL